MPRRASAADAGVIDLHLLTVEVATADCEAAAHVLFEAGVGGLEEESDGATARLIAYADSEEVIEHYRDAVSGWATQSGVQVRLVLGQKSDDEWTTAWTRYLRPEPVGDSFVLQPVAEDSPAP